MLHQVIGEIGAGTVAMAGESPAVRPEQGLVTVVATLDDQGCHFDHPGFRSITKAH
jgi:hypothetical protein